MNKNLAKLPRQLQAKAVQYWERFNANLSGTVTTDEQQIKTVFALSDFVAEQLIRNPDWCQDCIEHAPQESCYSSLLTQALSEATDEDQLLTKLRHIRNKEMVRIAIHDLSNKQHIKESLSQVSSLADALIMSAYNWLYQSLTQRYGIPLGSKGPQHLLIIGMGKLGGKELNFSSDIDLIFAYPEPGEVSSGRKTIEHQQFFIKLAQKLINALHKTTLDGQVFRVDMRLRPFGDSGPLVTHFSSLEDYYQEQGREWERYAMLKGRVLNPASPYVEELQQILKPFVFRRYIDFGVIESLRTMKQLIRQEVRRRNLKYNIKLGAGGIREIEFIVQCFQLTRGGRLADLQNRQLLTILPQLSKHQILNSESVQSLERTYLLLRKIEHCLQQFNDQQTQDLPSNDLDQLRLTLVMQSDSYTQLENLIEKHMTEVAKCFQDIIGDTETIDDDDSSEKLKDLWQLALSEEEAFELLQDLLPTDHHPAFITQLNQVKEDLARKPIGVRGKDRLDKLMPRVLLVSFEKESGSPTDLLNRLYNIIKSICMRTTYLDLLTENHGALNQLATLSQKSPWVAEQIAHFPLLLDELINPQTLYDPTPLSDYPDLLRQQLLRVPEEDLELQMESLRQFKLSQQLRVAAGDISGSLPVMKVSDHLTLLAESIISETLNMAWHQMVEKYGYPHEGTDQNKQFAVIGYGKLGGIELGYSSDLDLVFVHSCSSNAPTTGAKQIESKQFYIKLAQRILHLFNTKTASGELYEIDMRLRPSGNSGLLVSHIDAFKEYQKQEAWIWEHQALVRARSVAGDGLLRKRFEQVRKEILSLPRDETELKVAVREMREKMRAHLDNSKDNQYDLKQGTGGIADIEFLAQFWCLNNGHIHPKTVYWSDNVRIFDSLVETSILSSEEGDLLKSCYISLRNASHRNALSYNSNLVDDELFETQRKRVVAIWERIFG